MKLTRLITVFLYFSLFFGNMAWAMDQCGLSCAFSTQLSEQSLSQPETALNNAVFSADNSVEKNCNQICAGWTHLHYISFTGSLNIINKTHIDVMPRAFIYHSMFQKPPTEPPKA